MEAWWLGNQSGRTPWLYQPQKQNTTKQAVWLRRLLEDVGLDLGGKPFQLLNDNAGAIALSKNPVYHGKSKHIDMRPHFIREKVADRIISLEHARSAGNLADLLTKGLPTETFTKLCDLLRMKKMKMEKLDQGGVLKCDEEE